MMRPREGHDVHIVRGAINIEPKAEVHWLRDIYDNAIAILTFAEPSDKLSVGSEVDVDVYYDDDSSTYVLRLVKGARVLVFRLSEAQVRTSGREAECERTLKRKVKDLWNLI